MISSVISKSISPLFMLKRLLPIDLLRKPKIDCGWFTLILDWSLDFLSICADKHTDLPGFSTSVGNLALPKIDLAEGAAASPGVQSFCWFLKILQISAKYKRVIMLRINFV